MAAVRCFRPVPLARLGRSPSRFASSISTPEAAHDDLKHKLKADWKRRQSGSNFIDTLSLTVVSGRGGPGGVAFHREKFKARGPPSGGSGGVGGSVYLVASPTVTSLAHLPRTVRGGPGSAGGGKWLAGKRGEDVVIRVPVGTVVREVDEALKSEEDDEREREERLGLEHSWEVNKVRLHEAEKRDQRWNAWKKVKERQDKFGVKPGEAPIEPWHELDEHEFEPEKLEALAQFRKKMFTMYPQAELTGHPSFLATEHHLLSKILSREVELPGIKKPRRRRLRSGKRTNNKDDVEPLLYYDLTKPTPVDEPILLVSGGQPGLGNPSFLTHEDRSPKYATKGGAGETMRLSLEVKSNGEVGLVGLPNAGKSTLLRSLTSSTPRVASFAFTTLNPHLGTCVVYSDGSFSGPRTESSLASLSDTPSSPTHFSGHSASTTFADSELSAVAKDKKEEVLRFTITDNPGLLPNSHLNHGLGHAFLRHIERCTSLIYVVDLSNSNPGEPQGGRGGIKMDPVETLRVLETSLTEYEKVRGLPPGELVRRVKGVVGNKADLFRARAAEEDAEDDSDVTSVEEGRKRLQDVQNYVAGKGDDLWVIPVSAKNRQNVGALVKQLAKDVEAEREKKRLRLEREEMGLEDGEAPEDEDYDRWVR
ncbi:hypothetical protein JCM11491_002924 [Sporobolomyces phaffii]